MFEEVAILGVIEGQLERLLMFSGTRLAPEAAALSPEDAFRYLHKGRYGDDLELSMKLDNCDLTELGVYAFDHLFVFLVDHPDGQLLLWGDRELANISHARLSPLLLDVRAREYLDLLSRAIKEHAA